MLKLMPKAEGEIVWALAEIFKNRTATVDQAGLILLWIDALLYVFEGCLK